MSVVSGYIVETSNGETGCYDTGSIVLVPEHAPVTVTSVCSNCSASLGFYCPQGSVSAAGTACPAGFYCTGSSAHNQPCSANPGYYCPTQSYSSDGTTCPAGFYCEGGSSNRVECPAGTYSNTTGLTSSSACTFCEGDINQLKGKIIEVKITQVRPFSLTGERIESLVSV